MNIENAWQTLGGNVFHSFEEHSKKACSPLSFLLDLGTSRGIWPAGLGTETGFRETELRGTAVHNYLKDLKTNERILK